MQWLVEVSPNTRQCNVSWQNDDEDAPMFLATGPGRDPGQLWPLNPAIGLLLLCVVAPLSYHYFEKPFLRLSAAYRQAKPNSAATTA